MSYKMKFELFPDDVKFDEFDYDDILRSEENILRPQLEKLGYSAITFEAGMRASFASQTRLCHCLDPAGDIRHFVYS